MGDWLRAWLARLDRWVGLHPVAGSAAVASVADEIVAVLSASGLAVERWLHPSGELLIARRHAAGPVLGMYGHYDVEPGSRTRLQVVDGRVFGRGVGDNLGPLALRLSLVERNCYDFGLCWVIDPGEEIGSPALADWIATSGPPAADLWLDETGYFEADGAQRLLVVAPNELASEAARRCRDLAAAARRPTRTARRYLRRIGPTTGGAVRALFRDLPYLALGPNDDDSDVHGERESLPVQTLQLSARQLQAIFQLFSTGPRR